MRKVFMKLSILQLANAKVNFVFNSDLRKKAIFLIIFLTITALQFPKISMSVMEDNMADREIYKISQQNLTIISLCFQRSLQNMRTCSCGEEFPRSCFERKGSTYGNGRSSKFRSTHLSLSLYHFPISPPRCLQASFS